MLYYSIIDYGSYDISVCNSEFAYLIVLKSTHTSNPPSISPYEHNNNKNINNINNNGFGDKNKYDNNSQLR